MIDLNYIPQRWLREPFPLEIDQKLYETYILYDRDWSLTNTRDWLVRVYRRPYRIDLRTEGYVIESDILLSKAFSAYVRGDFQSSCVFTQLAVESILKTFLEINFAPISKSRFIELLRECTNKMGMPHIFTGFLTVAQLREMNHNDAERKLKLFEGFWKSFSSHTREYEELIDSLHFGVKTRLKYYGKPEFLQGVVARTKDIISRERYTEASHYLFSTLYNMVESYVPFISMAKKTKISHTTFISALRGLEEPAHICECIIEAFGVNDLDHKKAREFLRVAKELILGVRRWRKVLIGWFVG